MSREEYLNQLHKYLRKLPRQDYEDAMEYFTEYFQETDEEGAEELMKELGTPKEAARELMANLLNKKIEDHQNYETDGQTRAEQKGSGKHVVWIALLVLFAAPVGAPLLAAFAAVVLALVVCVFAILLCVVLCLMLIGGKILSSRCIGPLYQEENPCPRYTGSPVFYERFCNAYRKWAVGCGRWHPWCTVVRISM